MIHQSDQPIRKYDIWLADLPAVPESHVQSGVRPVIVVSNDIANAHSPIISIAAPSPTTTAPKPVNIGNKHKPPTNIATPNKASHSNPPRFFIGAF